mgnify:CR=1 FL=1
MGRNETQAFIEAQRIGALFVGGELDESAAAFFCALDRPFEQRSAEPLTASTTGDAYAFDQRAPAALIGQIRDIGQLQHARDLAILFGDDELVVGVGIDRCKRLTVTRRQRAGWALACRAQGIVGQQLYERVEIIGHTDNSGSRLANLALSANRAEAVKAALVDKGIPARSLITLGAGSQRPIASNDTAAGRARNRRIEFRIRNADNKNDAE